MLLTVFILTVLLPSAVNTNVVEHKDVYERIVHCLKIGYSTGDAVASEKDDAKTICNFWKPFDECLAKPFNVMSPSMELLDFYRAYEWQKGIVATESKFCTDLKLEDLKDLALKSDIMEKEKLPNMEDDDYEPCVGDAHRDCIVRAGKAFASHVIDLNVFFDCYTEKAKSCKASMMKHLSEIVQAFKKHMQEKHALFWKILTDLERSEWH